MGGKLPQSQEVSMMRGGGAMLCLGGKISDLPDSKKSDRPKGISIIVKGGKLRTVVLV